MNKRFWRINSIAIFLLTVTVQASAQEELHIYNWSDYIAEDTVANFQTKTGIKVTYDVYDSNEVLEAKLFAGKSGYDIVFPTARPFADRQIKAKIFQPLNKAALTNMDNLDPVILKSLTDIDPGNQYLVPYMWGTTGIAYNVDKVQAILGKDMPLNTWKLVFDPAIVAKLSTCGVALMDDATEVFTAARAYLGLDSNDLSDKALEAAGKVVSDVRANLRYFHSSQTINDIANGDICVAHGYSGDMLQARSRAAEAANGINIEYAVPVEGAVVWTDVMAIPADAPNAGAALKFINYIMEPQVAASISNYVAYANANSKATPLVDEAVRNNPGVYPSEETRSHLVTLKTPTEEQARAMTRLWTRVKTGM